MWCFTEKWTKNNNHFCKLAVKVEYPEINNELKQQSHDGSLGKKIYFSLKSRKVCLSGSATGVLFLVVGLKVFSKIPSPRYSAWQQVTSHQAQAWVLPIKIGALSGEDLKTHGGTNSFLDGMYLGNKSLRLSHPAVQTQPEHPKHEIHWSRSLRWSLHNTHMLTFIKLKHKDQNIFPFQKQSQVEQFYFYFLVVFSFFSFFWPC